MLRHIERTAYQILLVLYILHLTYFKKNLSRKITDLFISYKSLEILCTIQYIIIDVQN